MTGSRHPIPWKVLEQHVAILGKTRSGKSSVMRGLVERLLDDGRPVAIVDPKGDWWGIKLAEDGKRPGYPVVIFGGEHADVPINEHAGAHVAELFATGNRPCLIDLGGWMVGERTRFWIAFASTLFKLTRGTRWLAVDEIHNFAPKGRIMDPDAGKSLHWANRLASEGLGKGLPMIFASQRPQKVHNDTLTSAETLIAMRVLHPSDREAVTDWIKGCGDVALGAEVLATLAQMDRGEGWVWSPEIGFGPKRIKFPMFKTYDSFRPQTAADTKALTGWASVDLEEVRAKLAVVVREAEENDPRRLKQRVRELEAAARAKGKATAPDKAVLDQIAANAAQHAKVEVQRRIKGILLPLAKKLREAEAGMTALLAEMDVVPQGKVTTQGKVTVESFKQAREITTVTAYPRRLNGHASTDATLPRGERAILIAAAQHAEEGITREHLTVLTGYKRSSRDAYVARAKERGYVALAADRVVATSEGIAALGSDYEPLPTGAALREYWLARLPEGERRVLEILVAAWPNGTDRAALDEATGYKRSSRDAYIARLRARELVATDSEGVRAVDRLME